MRLIIQLIIAAVFCGAAHAAPSITGASGTYSTGQTVIISGAGFGAKIPAAPKLWAPFDSNINPSSLGQVTSWSATGGVGCEVYSSTGGWVGGAVRTNPSNCFNTSSYSMSLSANVGQINGLGARFYFYRHRNLTEDKTSDGSNIKNLMFERLGEYGSGEVMLTHGLITGDIWNGQNMTPSSYFYTDQRNLGWHTEEVVAQVAASTNQNAAVFDYSVDGVSHGSVAGGKVIGLNSGNVIDTVMGVYHGHYSSSGSQELAYFDDIYFDNTWSRVVIGNASTYSASTHREMQIPTSWNSSSISVSFNSGSFANNASVYLYVFDQDGGVNSTGYGPITISATSATTTCYQDADNDGYGHGVFETVETCSSGYYIASHFTALTGDADDNDASVYPGSSPVTGGLRIRAGSMRIGSGATPITVQ